MKGRGGGHYISQDDAVIAHLRWVLQWNPLDFGRPKGQKHLYDMTPLAPFFYNCIFYLFVPHYMLVIIILKIFIYFDPKRSNTNIWGIKIEFYFK